MGAVVPDFSLKDIHRRSRSLAGFKDKKAFAVIFIDTECPVAALYVPTLVELQRTYAQKGVQFLAIDSSGQDSFVTVSAFAQERNVPFPVLKDFDQQVADDFGARRTPEAFVLDANRVIRYHGRIDDQYGVGVSRDKPASRDLAQALDDLLAGKPIATPRTEPAGCPIERAGNRRSRSPVTYARDVAPVIQKRCQECHRPGEIGPFSLLTYEDAQKRTSRIREAVLEERMPPWHADPRFGHFANDRRLGQDERDMLLAWIDQGATKGDDKDLPPPLKFTRGWKIGEPDKIFTMQSEFTVPATGVLDYQRFVVNPGFKEDVWVQAAECRPGNRKVVHHIIVYVLPPGQREPYDADGTAATLVGWAPGDMPAIYSPDTGRLVRAGSRLVFEVHYTPNGTEQTDRSSIGIKFAKKPPANAVETNILANMLFRIPPGAASHQGQMTYAFRDDAVLSVVHAAHASAWNQCPVRFDLSRRDDRDSPVGARLRLQLAERLPIREAGSGPERKQADVDRPLGQLGRQSPQPRPEKGGLLGPANLGRNAKWLDGTGVEEAEIRIRHRSTNKIRIMSFPHCSRDEGRPQVAGGPSRGGAGNKEEMRP